MISNTGIAKMAHPTRLPSHPPIISHRTIKNRNKQMFRILAKVCGSSKSRPPDMVKTASTFYALSLNVSFSLI
jgi:hypothetical protein